MAKLNPKREDGYIYLIQCGALYKVGYSTNPWKRLRQLQSPGKPRLVSVLSTNVMRWAEKHIHYCISDFLVYGEWYKLPEEFVECFKNTLGVLWTEQEGPYWFGQDGARSSFHEIWWDKQHSEDEKEQAKMLTLYLTGEL